VDDLAQPPSIEKLLFILAQVQCHLGAAIRLLHRLYGVAALARGLPAHPVLLAESGAARGERHPVGHDEGGIEAHAELADELGVGILVAGHLLQELARSRTGDGADGLHYLVAGHADTVVRHRHRTGIPVCPDADSQVGIVLVEGIVR